MTTTHNKRMLLAAVAMLLSLAAAAQNTDRLDFVVRRAAMKPAVKHASLSVCVHNITKDSTVYARNEDLAMVPAALNKLFTTAAAFSRMGLRMGFGTLVFAHVTFCLPFVIITLRARIADFDRSLEEAAMDLGANEWRTMKRVTLPILAPGILAGAFMSITLSIDDVIISYFVSGSDQLTFPIKVYGMVRGKISTQVYVVSSLLIFVVVAVWLIGMAVRASYQRRHPE